jgi:type IX secretion system PorP/SprF family membrane protein
MNSKIITFLILLCAFQANAQDPVFTQFYLVPETLNPAFTGISNTWNAGLVHRRQWPDGNRKMDTQFAFVNTIVSDEIGVGMTVMNQNEIFTNLNYFKINAAMSYRVNINYDWRLRLGLETGLGRKDFNFGSLLLEDQININTGQINPISIDPGAGNQNNQINFLDLGAGFEFDQEYAWFGMSVKHLNRPNVAFKENANLPLDLFISVHGGYYYDLNDGPANLLPEGSTLLFTANYMRQGQYNRLDLGTIIDFNRFSIGVIAATNPEGRSDKSHVLTSINPVMSVKFSEFTFGYSYDWNVSNIGRTQGIHELTLVWQSSRRCDRCDDYSLKLKRNGERGYNKL